MCLIIMQVGYNAVSRGPQISATRGEMGTTANNNAVINCHLFYEVLMLTCTGVSTNNLMILRNLKQKYNCVAEFVALPSAIDFTAPIRSFFKPIYCVIDRLGLCGDFLNVCLKRDQFL